jgi:hypothetical protein
MISAIFMVVSLRRLREQTSRRGTLVAAPEGMGAQLAATIDFVHALVMVVWIAGIPLLFWHKWPKLSRAYVVFCLAFLVVTRVSHALLGECSLTTLARNASSEPSHDWFTVRFAEAVFRMRPTEQSIVLLSEGLLLVCCVGFFVYWRSAQTLRRSAPPAPRQRESPH